MAKVLFINPVVREEDKPKHIPYGIALLAFYSLGLSLPFILASLLTDQFMRHSKFLKRHGRALHLVAGGLLVLMGLAMITGYLTDFSIWLLQTFPSLAEFR